MPNIITYPEAKSIVVSGDIHGEFETLVYQMCVQYDMRDTLLIVAGDCGFGFEKPAYCCPLVLWAFSSVLAF